MTSEQISKELRTNDQNSRSSMKRRWIMSEDILILILKNVDFVDSFRLGRVSHQFRIYVNEVLSIGEYLYLLSSNEKRRWKVFFQKLTCLQRLNVFGKYSIRFLKMISQSSPKIQRLVLAEDFLKNDLNKRSKKAF